ncbi:MAG: matrixin family metalloprotease [Chthoniobacterales bacterium]
MFTRSPRCFRCLSSVLLLWLTIASGNGFWTLNYGWKDSTVITVQLELGPTNVHLDDGSGTWDNSAIDALSLWNAYLETIQFQAIPNSTSTEMIGDGKNSVFFSDSVFGDDFGGSALAVTVYLQDNHGDEIEADVLVNTKYQFNSYRGALRTGNPTVYDLHRILLHEFGHVFGLGHPDDVGQTVDAIMNSFVSDLDHLTDDDIAGADDLYGIKVISDRVDQRVGQPVDYQIPTNVPGVSYEADNLPAGLSLNSKTGLITGVLSLSGDYTDSAFTVHGARTSAVGSLPFFVSPDPPQNLRANYYWQANRVLMDESRHRAYVTISAPPSVAVLDAQTFSLVKTIPTETEPLGVAMSLDGKKLFVAQFKETEPALMVIDLTSLATLPDIPAPFPTYDVAAGSNNRLFITRADSAGIVQIDATTGAVLAPFPVNFYLDGRLEISSDLKTLFVAAVNYSPPFIFAVDVSGDSPAILQQTAFNEFSGKIEDLKLSHDGTFLCVPNDAAEAVKKLSSTDFTLDLGDFLIPNHGIGGEGAETGRAVEISPDDSTMFVTDYPQAFVLPASIDLFDSVTRKYLRSVDMGGFGPDSFTVDPTGQYLFASCFDPDYVPQLRVYATGLPAAPLHPAKPRSLLNVSTRLEDQLGDNVLIGGFIISGNEPKQVAIRGIGPSLPVEGALADPVLSLYDSSNNLLAFNDNWNSNRAVVLATGLAPGDEHEPAIVTTLAPGAYTVIISPSGDTSGIALVEVYDLTPDSDSALANISTRGEVGQDDNVMIGGFIVSADAPTDVLIRAIGPSLSQSGVTGALQDPFLELHGSDGELILANDNWRSTQQTEIIATGIPPVNDRESAIIATLVPGNYTAIVKGQNNTTGVALIEVYNLDATTTTTK